MADNNQIENNDVIDSNLNKIKLKLKSNTIFAFQNDMIYSKLCNDQVSDDPYPINQISQISGCTANNSNFLSNIEDKSPQKNLLLFKFGNENEQRSNSCSISSEMEKNLESILDEFHSADDLNEAKIDFTKVEKHENIPEGGINYLKMKSIASIETQNSCGKGNDKNFSYEYNDNFKNLSEKEEDSGKKFEQDDQKDQPQNSVNYSYDSSSSNEKSEKYDEIIDIRPDKNDKMEANEKRVSAENGSLITQSSINSQMLKNKFGKNNENTNRSISFNSSISKSISSNLSYSHGMDTSNIINPNKNYNKFNQNKRTCSSNKNSHNLKKFNENPGKISFRPANKNINLNLSSPNYPPSNFSTFLPNRFCNSTNSSNNDLKESNNFLINLKNSQTHILPTNPAILDYDIDKAFSINMEIGNNYSNKKSVGNYVNQRENKFIYNSKNNDRNSNYELINNFNNNSITSQYNKTTSININNTAPQYANYANNAKINVSNFNINKNINTTPAFYINMNNYIYYNDDKKLLENLPTLLQEQTGCRFVQLKIEEKNKNKDLNFLNKFFEKIKDDLINIINDQFGNYVIQKFFEGIVFDSSFLANFFIIIRVDLFHIAINPFGTRFLQKSLENLTFVNKKIENDVVNVIFRELIINHSYDLIIDTNGNHVFQKILLMYPQNKNQFIYDELNKISLEVAKIKQGGCIFQRAFDVATLKQKKYLISEILNNIYFLINDEYGNFILQSVIYLNIPEVNDSIFDFLKDQLLDLSKKKFSSNVIDKFILLEDPARKNKLRHEIMNILIEYKYIGELICDVYGNYVVQKSLYVSEGVVFMEIINQIKSSFKVLKQTPHGKKIYENLINSYGDYFFNYSYKSKIRLDEVKNQLHD